MSVANVFYIYRQRLVMALGQTGFFAFVTFTSLSTGPLLSVLCQLGLIAWDRTLSFFRFRWLLLVYLVLFAILLVRIGGEFQLREVIVNDVSYAKASAQTRLVVWDYGLLKVKQHPLFGIGLNDWTKPWWYARKTSFENFWLGQAMRFGIPSLVFLALAWGVSFARIAMQKTLSPEEADYRRGYLIALTGLTLVLVTTGPWNSSSVLLMIYVGAGGWFYLQPQEVAEARDAAARRRRAAQARAFGRRAAGGGSDARRPVGKGPHVIATYRKLLDLLSPRERRNFYILLVMIVLMGIFQMLTVASILPLMFVLQHPAIVETSPSLSWLYSSLGFTSHRGFMLALASAVFFLVIFGMVFKAVTAYATYRFSLMRSYTISSRMLNGYLSQPYTWFLDRHSAGLGAAVLGEVQKVVTTALLPAMKFITGLATALALIALLLVVRPGVALIAAGVIGGIYALLYAGVRRRINVMGRERHHLNEQRFRIVGEAFGGMKDVKLLGLEGYFVDRFREPARRIAEVDAADQILREVPRYVIEGVAFGGLVGFILYLLLTGDGSFGSVIPILAVFAFTAIRLFPALQQVYGSLGQMRFAAGTLDKLHKDFVDMAGRPTIRRAVAGRTPRRCA